MSLTRLLLALVFISGPLVAARPVTGGAPPIALSDPDGQDLTLEELSVKAAVHGMLSLTEMELRFRNPHGRRMEGRFTCVLPPGATVSRFAKEVNGQLMEGEVVERLRANQVYDAILHEMRDPALLEQDQGNRFSARIFPIEANATVRLILSYSRLLPMTAGARTYSLPLRGLPTIGRFRFDGIFSPLPGEETAPRSSGLRGPVSGRRAAVETFRLDESSYTPKEDLEVTWAPTGSAPNVQSLRVGDFVLTAFRTPGGGTAARATNGPWIFFVDTSASGADGILHRGRAFARLLAALPASDDVELWAFDQEVVKLGAGSAGEWARRIESVLSERGLLGGTNLESALRSVSARAKERPGARLVLVSDGVATLGKTERSALEAAASGTSTFHALVLGSRQDDATLAALVAGRGRVVTLPFTEELDADAARAAARLRLPAGLELTVSDAGAEWIFPRELHDVQPGDEVVVVARMKALSDPAAVLKRNGRAVVSADGSAKPLPAGAFEPLLEREAYRAYLAHLAAREAGESDAAVKSALATEQVKVSIERRIMIPSTTLLVLESEADYRRFGLERRALASILTVGATGIERLDRQRPTTFPTERQKSADRDVRRTTRPESSAAPSGGKDAGRLSEPMRAEASEKVAEEIRISGEAPVVDTRSNSSNYLARPAPPAVSQPLQVPAPPPTAYAADAVGDVVPQNREDAPRPSRPAPEAQVQRSRVSPPVPPSTPAPMRRPDWTEPALISPADLKALRERVNANPLDRRGYNALTDALAARREWKELRDACRAWQRYDPENPQVYEMLGEAARELGRTAEAQRAFGSLVEIAPGKPELLQRAGILLFRAGDRTLFEVPLRRALELRPDRVNAYRHLAFALWQAGRIEEAARVLEEASRRTFPDWYGNAQRVLREELAYVYRAWLAKNPAKEGEIARRARENGADLTRTDAFRATLVWETDANDVDLHVVDPRGEECFYSHKSTATGLELYQDITRGFGPEVIRSEQTVPGPYSVGVKYFSAGPMGVSRGVLVVLAPTVKIVPFRLVEGGRDMRLLTRVEAASEGPGRKVSR